MLLVLSDILILSSFGLIAPIFAIFLIGIEGGTILTAGMATGIFLIVRSTAQFPLSRFLIDKHRHKTRLLLIGTSLIVLVPFIYILAKNVYVIFIAQAVYGLGTAFAYPSWFSLFTMYMDKRHRGFEYSFWSAGIGIGGAIAAFFGASIAESFGFISLFFVVGSIALMGFFILIFLDRIETREIRKELSFRRKKEREKAKRKKELERAKRRAQRKTS